MRLPAPVVSRFVGRTLAGHPLPALSESCVIGVSHLVRPSSALRRAALLDLGVQVRASRNINK